VLQVFFSLDTSSPVKIVRYKTSLGPAGFESGSYSELYGFAVMAVLIGIIAIVISRKVYPMRRNLALTVLALGIIAQLFNIVVANAILSLP